MKNRKILKRFENKPIIWVPMWGLSKLRKRGGGFAGNIPGSALWYDQWYERAMSRETAEKLSDLGVNLVVLPFSLGASHQAEEFERDDFQRMTEHLHEFGITSLPYLQYQNFLQEEYAPEDTVWAETLDGDRQQYSYWRRTACQSGVAFKRYFRELFSDAIRRGADGIWIDNNYLKPCRCANCEQAFKKYLRENRGELLDELYLTSFDHVEVPDSLWNTFDPIVQALLEFNCRRNLEDQRDLKNYLEELDPDALFGSNPALYRGASDAAKGVELHGLYDIYDLMYLENKFFPMTKNGQLSGNYHGMIAGEAAESLGIPGCWKRVDFDDTDGKPQHGMVDTAAEVERVILESVNFGGAVGMLWAVRGRPRECCSNADELREMYFETPEVFKAMRDTLEYVRELPLFGETKRVADVGVLYHHPSLMFDFDSHWAAIHGVEELLVSRSIPYRTIFSQRLIEDLCDVKLLVLPEVGLMNESEAELIRQYVADGGKLLAIGDVGLYDNRRRVRDDYLLKDLFGVSSFDLSREIVLNSYKKGETAFIKSGGAKGDRYINMMTDNTAMVKPNWLSRSAEIIDVVENFIGKDCRARLVSAPEGVVMNIGESADGRMLLQFFSYVDLDEPVEICVETKPRTDSVRGDLFVYKDGRRTVCGESRKDVVMFSISGFTRHAALLLE